MQFCWKMLPSWEQGWLNIPLSLICPGQRAGGSWGLPLQSQRQHCTQKHLAFLHQTEALQLFAFSSAVCAPCCICHSVLSFFSLPRAPATKKMLMPLLALAPRGLAQSIPSACGEHRCSDRATLWAVSH